jgi:GR25 family glycosyltransferase involved in LPS biosynthesis
MFNFFEKIYLINLEERKDRLEKSLINFKNYDINDFERVEGIKIDKENYPLLDNREKSQLGCALSFYKIIKNAYIKNLNSVLIFEDDFEFVHNKETTNLFLKKSIDNLPFYWDVIYLGANIMYDYSNNPIEKFSENLFRVNSAYCCHSIAFSKIAISKIIDIFPNESVFIERMNSYKAIDIFMAKEFCIENSCFITSEMLCNQYASFSSIEGCNCDYSNELIQRFENSKNNIC